MNKVICNICGTAYPETSSQCPICGTARQIDQAATAGEAAAPAPRPRVKGGRFSKANVRKRNKANQAAAGKAAAAAAPKKKKNQPKAQPQQKEGTSGGLIITAIILLIAIVLVLVFILVRFVFPGVLDGAGDTTTAPLSSTAAPADPATDPKIACTGLDLDTEKIVLDAVGRAWLLDVGAQPADTTDVIQFASSDEKVATVTEQGRITAVGEGEAVITVTCGSVSREVEISVAVPEETKPPVTTKPVETTEATEATEETTEPLEDVTLALDTEDIMFFGAGEFHRFNTGELSPAQITWTSEDPDIAEVKNGTVTAVAPGTTTIHAKYGDQEVTCIVRCNFEVEEEGGSQGSDEVAGPLTISHEDVTITVGETFTLRLSDYYGDTVSVSWSSSDSSVCTVSGNTVTGVGTGSATVSVTYDGVTYSCVVRVQ